MERHYEATIPPQVRYSLPQRGHEFEEILDAINLVARRWNIEDGQIYLDCPRAGQA